MGNFKVHWVYNLLLVTHFAETLIHKNPLKPLTLRTYSLDIGKLVVSYGSALGVVFGTSTPC